MNRPVLAFWYTLVIVGIMAVAFVVACGLITLLSILPSWAHIVVGVLLAIGVLYTLIYSVLD